MLVEFADLVDGIYEAAFMPERWLGVLKALEGVSGSIMSGLFTFGVGRAPSYIATERLVPIVEAGIVAGAFQHNVRPQRSLARQHAGWLSDVEIMTDAERARDLIYRDYLRPGGVEYTAGAVVPLPSGEMLVFDLDRSAEAGPFERRTLDALDTLRPHLARSALISARLGLDFARGASEALALLGLPTAVLARDGRLLAVNDLFEALPQARLAIGARDRMGFADKGADALFKQALATLGADAAPAVYSIPITATEEAPAFIAHLAPVRRSAHDLFTGGLALLIFTPVEAPEAPLRQVLTALFDLTPAEAHVARLLASGQTVEGAAEILAVTRETVRSHLKHVLAKTGVTRQADLMRLLAGTAARTPRGDG